MPNSTKLSPPRRRRTKRLRGPRRSRRKPKAVAEAGYGGDKAAAELQKTADEADAQIQTQLYAGDTGPVRSPRGPSKVFAIWRSSENKRDNG